jgi:hypothetical protein
MVEGDPDQTAGGESVMDMRVRKFVPVSLSPDDGEEHRCVAVETASNDELRSAVVLMHHPGQHDDAATVETFRKAKYEPAAADDDDEEEGG